MPGSCCWRGPGASHLLVFLWARRAANGKPGLPPPAVPGSSVKERSVFVRRLFHDRILPVKRQKVIFPPATS